MNNNSHTIEVKIITPTDILVSIDANIATFPGEEGEFGVMPNHMPMVISLKPGVVRIVDNYKEESKYFVFGGVLQIKNQHVNLITEYAKNIKLLSRSEIQEKVSNLKNLLSKDDLDDNASNSKIKYEKELQYLTALNNFLI